MNGLPNVVLAVTPKQLAEAEWGLASLVLMLIGSVLGVQWLPVVLPLLILVFTRSFSLFLMSIPLGYFLQGVLLVVASRIFGTHAGKPSIRESYFDIGAQMTGAVALALLAWLGLWIVWRCFLAVLRFFASLS